MRRTAEGTATWTTDWFFAPAMAAMLLAAGLLAGCGQGAEAKYAGIYELDTRVIMAGMEAEIAAIEDAQERQAMEMGMAMMGAGMLDMLSMTIILNADGTASSTSSMMGQSETVRGTWSARGHQMTIKMVEDGDAEAVNGIMSGDTLELLPPAEEDMPFRMVLVKQSR